MVIYLKNSIILFIFILFFFSLYFSLNKKESTLEIENTKVDYQEEINKLRNEYNNNDIVGVLGIENTLFYEIVMQYTNNDYYLNHSIDHSQNWKGQTFLDYRLDINNSNKLIIYGHNSNKHNLPFKIFENYYNKEYLEEHKYIYLQTDNEFRTYEIFSVFVEYENWDYYYVINLTNEKHYNQILYFKNKSFYEINSKLTKDDKILIIQTCSYHKDYLEYDNKFLLIVARKIKT